MRAIHLVGVVGGMAAVAGSSGALPTQVVAFGDSLVDVGNFYLASGNTNPASPPYALGRFSNGPVVVDDLAALLGLPVVTPSAVGGSGFGVGFALANDTPGPQFPLVPSLGQQVDTYLSLPHPNIGSGLFVLWAGANDLERGQLDPTVPALAVANQVKKLADAGAKEFLVMNLPPLQFTPDGLSRSALVQGQIGAWVNGYNAALPLGLAAISPLLLPDVKVHQFDAAGFYAEVIANPGAYGLTDVTNSALFSGAVNPNQYLFWDTVHPTAAGHLLLAQAAVTLVPEPGTMGILAVGLVGLLARRRMGAAKL